MGRRSDHSKEELYELAIDAGRKIVSQDGFRALTARNVADAIGYSPGTLYNHFANLDELIIHLNARTLDDLNDAMMGIVLTQNPEDDIRLVLDCYLDFIDTHAALWHMLFNYTLPDGQDVPAWYSLKVQGVLAIVENVLRPLFPENDTHGLTNFTRILWASLHGITSLSDNGKLQVVTQQSVRDMAILMVATMIRGVDANTA